MSHQFTLDISRYNRKIYSHSFFSYTSFLQDFLTDPLFPLNYNLQIIKYRINRNLRSIRNELVYLLLSPKRGLDILYSRCIIESQWLYFLAWVEMINVSCSLSGNKFSFKNLFDYRINDILIYSFLGYFQWAYLIVSLYFKYCHTLSKFPVKVRNLTESLFTGIMFHLIRMSYNKNRSTFIQM